MVRSPGPDRTGSRELWVSPYLMPGSKKEIESRQAEAPDDPPTGPVGDVLGTGSYPVSSTDMSRPAWL